MTALATALPPVGFWSYTRSDDRSARGRLSELRVLVASELQGLVGRERVKLFQDSGAIPPGAEWEREIGEALGTSSFLVPIVTPALLQSEWCCREIALFRKREQALGRSDLIFPIHYIDTSHLEPAEDCPAPEVFALLAGRQWIDFRDHRLRPPDSEAVARKLAEIAMALAGALRRRSKAAAALVTTPPPAAGQQDITRPLAALPAKRPAPSADADVTGRSPRPAARITECDRLAQPPRYQLQQSALTDGVAMREIDIPRARAACEAAVAAQPDEPRFRAWLGRVLEAAGLHAEAVAAYRPAAERGHLFAQNNLGNLLAEGLGIKRDDAQAVGLFRRAAEQGYPQAQANLGAMLAEGRGIPRNDAQAVEWYRRAAEQGSALGQNNLGFMLQNGCGVARNLAQAVEWYRRAAEQGYPLAQANLGAMLADGRGITRDHAKAAEWFRRAAEQGNAQAQNRLGHMLAEGQGMPRNDAKAVAWYRRAAEQGYAPAQANLAAMLAEGKGTARDNSQALEWYRQAAKQGYHPAQHRLGEMLERGHGQDSDMREAVTWYQRAAGQGNSEAQASLTRLGRAWS